MPASRRFLTIAGRLFEAALPSRIRQDRSPPMNHRVTMVEQPALVLRAVALSFASILVVASVGLPRRARGSLLPMVLCLMAYLVRSAPQWAGSSPQVLLPLAVGALLFPVAFWWLVHNAFEDRTDLPWPVWVAVPVLLIAGFSSGHDEASLSLLGTGPHVLQKVVAAGFVITALWRLWVSAAQDLVSGRRVLRGWLLAYIGAHGLVVLSVELILRGTPAPIWLDALNVGAIALALAIGLAFLMGFRPAAIETLFGPPDKPAAKPEPPVHAPPADVSADGQWVERLQRLMAVDCVYRDPELSLAALAQRIGLPEHRLRELIHRALGYRNFPAFVNEHRLREVEGRLADPAFDRRPILTLALEAGFGSIGPFNRAFRDRHGVTPTAFRGRRSATPAT
jgi:AraC-like DNA-binding protein